MFLGVLDGCRQHGQSVASNTDEKFLLADHSSPTGVFTTRSPGLIVKATDKFLRAAYSWVPGQKPRLLVQGNMLEITRLSDDSFAAWYSEGTSDSDNPRFMVTFNARQLTSQPLALPKALMGWGSCKGNDEVVVCLGNRPGMTLEDKDFDEMAFNAVLVIDLVQRRTDWFPVDHRTDYRLDVAHKLIYVSDWVPMPSRRLVDVFNFKGERLRNSQESDLQAKSPSGRFLESVQEEGEEAWQIYDNANGKELLAFNCDKPGCKDGYHNDYYWNPVIDGQVAVVRDGGQGYGKGTTCDVYQVSPPQLLKSIPCDGFPSYDWSRDGKELIILDESSGMLHRERMN
jgi:hypothetical protein